MVPSEGAEEHDGLLDRSLESSGAQEDLLKSGRTSQRAIWTLLLLLVFTHMANRLYDLPLNRVIEMRLCQDHYKQHDPSKFGPGSSVPEKLCKIDEVQQKLAWLQGIMEATTITLDFIVTIPFSFLAEKFGVRLVLWLNMATRLFMCSWVLVVGNFDHIFPTKAIIAGPFLSILGHECVLSSTIYALTATLTREYVQSASYFSYIGSATYVVSFVGPSLASITMSQSLWLPFWVAIALLLLASITIYFLPEKTQIPVKPLLVVDANDAETGPLLGDRPTGPDNFSSAFDTPKSFLTRILHTLKTLARLVVGRRNFQIILASYFLTNLASSDTRLLVQYISARYEWRFAEAGYLLSAKAAINILLLTIVVPRVIRTSMASKTIHGSENRLNFLGVKCSILVSILGVLCIAMSFKIWMLLASLMIYAVGSANSVFLYSLVKSPLIALQDETTHAQDFSLVMLTKSLGALVGAPLMTVLWVQAIKIGGAGLGLPYFVSASLYLFAAIVIAQLRL
ncbi:hypothetical protein BU16DRAFT_599240 [Lophium mytilinum]|uniref:MFS general substrate transporter n=1 Tax=Lophium mytilinum TaxID=390894 RepID=A0A6A6RA92_9PEZI|nr:hypothetical protein BU16DRAFT_599240 [Lophium mytilinum]